MVDSSQLSPLHTLSKQVPNTGNWILSIFNTVFYTNIEKKNPHKFRVSQCFPSDFSFGRLKFDFKGSLEILEDISKSPF